MFFRRQEERKVVRGRDGRREREGDGREMKVGGSERERERILGFYVLHDDITPYNEIMNPSQRLGINGFRLENDKEA